MIDYLGFHRVQFCAKKNHHSLVPNRRNHRHASRSMQMSSGLVDMANDECCPIPFTYLNSRLARVLPSRLTLSMGRKNDLSPTRKSDEAFEGRVDGLILTELAKRKR